MNRMIPKLALLLVLLTSTFGMNANPVDINTAREVGMKFMNANTEAPLRSTEDLQLVTTYTISRGDAAFYVFNTSNGFVIVAADDCSTPILGYSDEGQFSGEDIPIQLQEYLQSFVEQIQYGIENHLEADEATAHQWELVQTIGHLVEQRATTAVAPLLKNKSDMWGQGCRYNSLCPEDPSSEYCHHVMVGCVATSFAQIMRYWSYPSIGTGSHTYTPSGYPTQSVNFGATTYDWDHMPHRLSSSSNQTQINAVATLMWHCGVAVDMHYGPNGSGSGQDKVRTALVNYFDYSDELSIVRRNNYNQSDWLALMKSCLDMGRPIHYRATDLNSGVGHAFVCDGYNSNNHLHFNWGWGGAANGYFADGALNPQNHAYNGSNAAIINIHPVCDLGTSYQITATANPSNGGTVSGTGTYNCGTACTLTATANQDYAFWCWTENDERVSNEASYSFNVTEDKMLIAHFVPFGNIVFADANVKAICLANWDTNGDGELSYVEAALVTNLRQVFRGNTEITSFEELQFFIGLNSISNYAFQNCSGLESLKIPNSVTSIDDSAFSGCSGFTGTLTIPSSVTSIGNYAFYHCSGLTGTLTIPSSVTSVGNSAFSGCSGFTGKLTIPSSVTSIGSSAFSGCSGFTGKLTIPNSVTSIASYAFQNCSGLGSLKIPNSVTSIGESAFQNCSGLGSLKIPSSVTSIGNYAFSGCSGFTGTLTIPSSVISIGNSAFSGCSGFTGSLIIPNSVTSIGSSAFSGCSGFTGQLAIPSSVTSIADYAFQNCSGFTGSLTIPNSVTSIGGSAFSGCSGFTGSLTIPNSVTSIGGSAFSGCSGFTGSLTISNSVTSVANYAFRNCSGLESLTIPNSVTTIGNSAFSGCSGFTGNLTIPNSVTSIGSSAFYGCNSFTGNLTIPNSVTSIGSSAFYGCNSFTGNLTIGNSVTTIDYSAFSGCSGFTGSLTIPNSVTSVANYAFQNCSGLESLTIPNSVTSIGNSAFSGCSNLTSISMFAETPPTLGSSVFNNVNKTIPVYVPCGCVETYQSVNWGGFNGFYGMCGGTVTVAADPEEGGTVAGAGVYEPGTLCTVAASPNENYTFMNWTENDVVVSTQSEYTFAVPADRNLVAHFALPFNVTATANPTEGGTVNISEGDFSYGSLITLIAMPNEGYVFDKWTKDGEDFSYLSTLNLTVTEDAEYAAYFEPMGGIVIGEATSTSAYLPTNYPYSLSQQIYTAEEMGGEACEISSVSLFNTGTSKTRNFTIYMVHTSKTAFNGTNDWIAVTEANQVFSGSVTIAAKSWTTVYFATPFSYDGFSNIALIVDDNSHSYNNGLSFRTFSTVESQAIRIYGSNTDYDPYNPSGYTGTLMTEKNQVVFGVYYTVTTMANPEEGGTVNGGGQYYPNQPFTLTATPNEGYVFDKWTKDGVVVSCLSTLNLIATETAEYVAHFQQTDGIVIGEAASTNPNLPLCDKYSLTQQIYTAEEMGGEACEISSVSFYNTGDLGRFTFSIYMVNTDKTAFDGASDWIAVTPSDQVFSGRVAMASESWTTIYFNTPFVYDGTSNVALVVDNNSTTFSNMNCRTYGADGNQAILVSGSDTNYDPYNPSSYAGTLMPIKNQVVFGTLSYDFMVTAIVGSEEGGSVSGGGLCYFNQPITLTAMPNEGYVFNYWTKDGNVVSCLSTYDLAVTETAEYVANFQQVEGIAIGEAALTSSCLPTANNNYSLTQQIYTSEEMGGEACGVSNVSFFNTGTAKTRNITVYLANTSKTAFNGTDDWIPVTEADRVFSGSVTMAAKSWTTICFATPFSYDGSSNVALIVDDNSNTANFSSIECRTFETGESQAIWIYGFGTNYDPCNPSGYTGALMSVKNQIVLGITVPTITQTIDLVEGWNWFSTYIEVDDPVTMLQMVEASLGENGIQIKSSLVNTEYDSEWGWFGDLDDVGMTNEQMYAINVSAPCTVTLEGTPANPANHPITIYQGWNWIGFPSAVAISLEDAFAGFAQEGDKIKNRVTQIEYDPEWGWYGDFETLEPGQGYMYYSASSTPRTLVFPAGAK